MAGEPGNEGLARVSEGQAMVPGDAHQQGARGPRGDDNAERRAESDNAAGGVGTGYHEAGRSTQALGGGGRPGGDNGGDSDGQRGRPFRQMSTGTGFQVFDEDVPMLDIEGRPMNSRTPPPGGSSGAYGSGRASNDGGGVSAPISMLPQPSPTASLDGRRLTMGAQSYYKPHSFDERTGLHMHRRDDDETTAYSDYEAPSRTRSGLGQRSTSFSLNQEFDDERLDQDLSHVHMAELIVGVVANLNDETDLSVDHPEEGQHEDSSIFESFFDLTHARLQHIFRAFDELSKGKEAGIVDYRNFRKSLRDAGLDIRDEASFRKLVQKVDLDLDGGITFAEFETVVQSLKLAHVLKSSRFQWQQPFRCINYNPKRAEEERVNSSRVKSFMYNPRPSWATHRWIELVAPCTFHLKCLAIKHRLHPLALEDCLKDSARSRAKLDRYDTHVLVCFPVMTLVYDGENDEPTSAAGNPDPLSRSRSTSSLNRSRSGSWLKSRWSWNGPRNSTAEPLIRRQRSHDEGSRSYAAVRAEEPKYSRKGNQNRFRIGSFDQELDGEIHVEVPRVVKHNAYIFLSRPDLTTTITVINEACSDLDVFRRVRRELEVSYSRLRTHDGMYLLYSLIDCLADSIVPIVHTLEKILAQLSAQVRDERHNVVTGEGEQRFSQAYHDMIRELQNLKRWMIPAQRVVSNLIAEEELIESDCKIYLRDVHDHLEQITDDINSILGGLHTLKDEHDHQIEVRMSGTMNALTIVATASLPGQFLASVFGMNFDSMEELHWKYGYLMFWCLTIASWSMLFFYFRYKGYV
ncbi:Magnesium and cobalt transport protein CorA, putative [Hondaea fermentalgiana]|uniref:Magnesium and cobalt transport protein CorA, putative n=1 Tax=Hondaea fermentalgiana TaxID=2315210 RepID=A0A2R5GHH8_9STRA|nr:Magnesium and cobalt transport protein CorA, putative [Hondaea fermentalgiana]|eukprot:GBG30340.1 Magnesium and cobalt transport protein CorA, putative [Hondaea fermentalgiana]